MFLNMYLFILIVSPKKESHAGLEGHESEYDDKIHFLVNYPFK